MKKIKLYLDDLRDCPEGCLLVKTAEEAIEVIKGGNVGLLSLDRDLGLDVNGNHLRTGYDLVKEFYEKGMYVDEIYIHTDNSVGRENMYQTLLASQRRGFISKDIKIYRYGLYPNVYSD